MDIRLAYSPDSDDFFMFYPAMMGWIPTGEYRFLAETFDTQKLNQMANESNRFDVSAISLHAYADLADHYLVLPHGASVGRNYGPVLISKEPRTLDSLAGDRIAVPGLKTTAYLVLKLMIPSLTPVVTPIEPFYRIFDSVEEKETDAGLVIHEGRLIYRDRGFHLIADIGKWWYSQFALPLPLGVNVIRRDLGRDHIRRISEILQDSIRYSLAHREDMIRLWVATDPRGIRELKNTARIDEYLSLYANADTESTTPDVKLAASLLLKLGVEHHLIPHPVEIDWA